MRALETVGASMLFGCRGIKRVRLSDLLLRSAAADDEFKRMHAAAERDGQCW